jgi:hypothetical protein
MLSSIIAEIFLMNKNVEKNMFNFIITREKKKKNTKKRTDMNLSYFHFSMKKV